MKHHVSLPWSEIYNVLKPGFQHKYVKLLTVIFYYYSLVLAKNPQTKHHTSMTNIWVTVMKILLQTDQEMGQIQSKWFVSENLNKDFFSFAFTYLFICSQSSSINCNVLTGTSLALLWSESSSEDRYLRDCLEREKLDLDPGSIECCGCYLLVQKKNYTWLWITHLFGTVASFNSLS